MTQFYTNGPPCTGIQIQGDAHITHSRAADGLRQEGRCYAAHVSQTSVAIIVPDTFYLLIDMPADRIRSG